MVDFFENELSEPLMSRKKLMVFVANGKIQAFK